MNRILCIVLAVAALLFFCACSEPLGETETYALDILTAYREMLVDPDSMVLRGDLSITYTDDAEGEAHTYCFFTASGNNAQGIALTSTLCYLDGAFFCDMEDLEMILANGMGTTDTVMDIALLIRAQDVWEKYQARNTTPAVSVDGEKIAKKLNISWEDLAHD